MAYITLRADDSTANCALLLTCICLTARCYSIKKIQCNTVTSLRSARYAITLTRSIYTHVWTRKGEGGKIRKNNTSS